MSNLDNLRIKELRITDVKRVQAVHITPKGNVIELAGKNGNGKTSILDAILWAFSNSRVIQANPVRDGADEGEIFVDLGELTIRKKLPRGKPAQLIVENAKGVRQQKPQDLLDSLVGKVAFDPLAVLRAKPDERTQMIKSFVPGFDFEAAEGEVQKAFRERTDVSRRLKELRAQTQDPGEGVAFPENFESLREKVRTAQADNERIRSEARELDAARAELRELGEQIARLQARYDDLEAMIAVAPEAPALNDIEDLERQFNEALEQHSQATRHKAQREIYEKQLKLLKEVEADEARLTKIVDDGRAAIRKAVEDAKLPVPGMTLDEDGVKLDGQPFEQASDAQQLRASTLLAMAMNPKLHVIRIREGAFLDEDGMALLDQMAAEHDFQIWIERVIPIGDGAIIIEDGMVKEAETPKSKPAAKK